MVVIYIVKVLKEKLEPLDLPLRMEVLGSAGSTYCIHRNSKQSSELLIGASEQLRIARTKN